MSISVRLLVLLLQIGAAVYATGELVAASPSWSHVAGAVLSVMLAILLYVFRPRDAESRPREQPVDLAFHGSSFGLGALMVIASLAPSIGSVVGIAAAGAIVGGLLGTYGQRTAPNRRTKKPPN